MACLRGRSPESLGWRSLGSFACRNGRVGDLGVKNTDRAAVVAQMVRESGGQAWWVGDESIGAAGEALQRGPLCGARLRAG